MGQFFNYIVFLLRPYMQMSLEMCKMLGNSLEIEFYIKLQIKHKTCINEVQRITTSSTKLLPQILKSCIFDKKSKNVF